MKTQHSVHTRWKEDLAFDIEVDGHLIRTDASEEFGGKNYGPTPKPLLLSALAGCTGIDVASILKKMRVHFDDMSISVSGELSEDPPRVYEKIHVIYEFKGTDLDTDKLEKAVELSHEKYCGVTAMLREVADITTEIRVVE
ncbi:MAG: OsmC family protein [Bacteroidetes bacterium]|nr:OsmC family protein [Bacteroidota bacterium]MBU1720865.1 OsmC family protein [Bacteroidota bacterium]